MLIQGFAAIQGWAKRRSRGASATTSPLNSHLTSVSQQVLEFIKKKTQQTKDKRLLGIYVAKKKAILQSTLKICLSILKLQISVYVKKEFTGPVCMWTASPKKV